MSAFFETYSVLSFQILHTIVQGELVSLTYTMTFGPVGSTEVISGIEIFRIVDGRITEVWNPPYGKGLWG